MSVDTKSLKLTAKQELALALALNGETFFLSGPGGVGKSIALNVIIERLIEAGFTVAVTASTGVAAVNINGTTIHSFAGIGIAEQAKDTLLQKAKSVRVKEAWKDVDVLILDEVSMLSPDYFEKLEAVTRVARNNNTPFGGIQVILVGDFFQLPPVFDKKKKETMSASELAARKEFCFETDTWKQTIKKVVLLTEVLRQKDTVFIDVLSRIRDGTFHTSPHRDADIRLLKSRVGADVSKVKPTTTGATAPGDGKAEVNQPEASVAIEPTELRAYNADVDMINNARMASLSTDDYDFEASYGYKLSPALEGKVKQLSERQKKTLEELIKNCPARSPLTLREGSQVMLLCNISVTGGLVNGSRGVITRFIDEGEDSYPVVQFKNCEVVVRRQLWRVMDKGLGEAWYYQIPLRLAYACSIHKSQGQSLDSVSVKLDRTVFEYGQAYTALSRVRSLDGLTLTAFDPACIRTHPKVIRFYKELQAAEANSAPISSSASSGMPFVMPKTVPAKPTAPVTVSKQTTKTTKTKTVSKKPVSKRSRKEIESSGDESDSDASDASSESDESNESSEEELDARPTKKRKKKYLSSDDDDDENDDIESESDEEAKRKQVKDLKRKAPVKTSSNTNKRVKK